MFETGKIWRRAFFAVSILIMGFSAVFVGGCSPVQATGTSQAVGVSSICPGQENISAVVAKMNFKRQCATPVRASGKCTICWYDQKGKRQTESPSVQMRFVPPYKLYLDGSSFGQEFFKLGTNHEDFWFRSKPADEYYYGKRANAEMCTENHLINPATLLEALGFINIDSSWELKHIYGRDILTKNSVSGRPLKRVHIDACDYNVIKIEYFDNVGNLVVTTELSGYEQYPGGRDLTFPRYVSIISHGVDTLTVDIKFAGIKLFEPTAKQLNGTLFLPPSKSGFENIYEMGANCEFIRR